MYELLAVLALFTFIYSLLADRIEKTWVSGAMVFCAFGMVAGPGGLNVLPATTDSEGIKSLDELTLALVLFTDASSVNLGILRRNARLPVRLLATMLAPTDAALGKPVITNTKMPVQYSEGLNVESGLNDGICVPVLMIFLELATGRAEGGASIGIIFSHFAAEIGIGASVGLGLTLIRMLPVYGTHCPEWACPSKPDSSSDGSALGVLPR